MTAAASSSRPSHAVTGSDASPVLELNIKEIRYSGRLAVRDVTMSVAPNSITAFIGPSGCGKSSVLRCVNRMNDLIPAFSMEGSIQFQGRDVNARDVDPVAVRRHIGMVFQQPNPFAMSIFRNVSFGLRLNGDRGDMAKKVETALRRAALWDEVKDKLHTSGLALSGGQQQRLCIARAIATDPPVLLMDEPCSALDPTATSLIESLMLDLKQYCTIVIVTHNLQQAKRVADRTAFFYVNKKEQPPVGYLIEYEDTKQLFENPAKPETRDYVEGKFS